MKILNDIIKHPLWIVFTIVLTIISAFLLIPKIIDLKGCQEDSVIGKIGFNEKITLPLHEEIKICTQGYTPYLNALRFYNSSKWDGMCNYIKEEYLIDEIWIEDSEVNKAIIGTNYIFEQIIEDKTPSLKITYKRCGFKNNVKKLLK